MRPLLLDFFRFMVASWHESSAQERSIQTILRSRKPIIDRSARPLFCPHECWRLWGRCCSCVALLVPRKECGAEVRMCQGCRKKGG